MTLCFLVIEFIDSTNTRVVLIVHFVNLKEVAEGLTVAQIPVLLRVAVEVSFKRNVRCSFQHVLLRSFFREFLLWTGKIIFP